MNTLIKSLITFIIAIFSIGLAAVIIGYPLMWLWNWLMPAIFNLAEITFWQSVGLFLLSSLLVKNLSNNN